MHNLVIIFYSLQKTVQHAPQDYIARINMFNTTYELYTHRYLTGEKLLYCTHRVTNAKLIYIYMTFFFLCSYLGNGLVAARLKTLGALGADGNGSLFSVR